GMVFACPGRSWFRATLCLPLDEHTHIDSASRGVIGSRTAIVNRSGGRQCPTSPFPTRSSSPPKPWLSERASRRRTKTLPTSCGEQNGKGETTHDHPPASAGAKRHRRYRRLSRPDQSCPV